MPRSGTPQKNLEVTDAAAKEEKHDAFNLGADGAVAVTPSVSGATHAGGGTEAVAGAGTIAEPPPPRRTKRAAAVAAAAAIAGDAAGVKKLETSSAAGTSPNAAKKGKQTDGDEKAAEDAQGTGDDAMSIESDGEGKGPEQDGEVSSLEEVEEADSNGESVKTG